MTKNAQGWYQQPQSNYTDRETSLSRVRRLKGRSLRALTSVDTWSDERALTRVSSGTRGKYANYMPVAPRRRKYKMSDSEEDLALVGVYLISKQKLNTRQRRVWIHDATGRRLQLGKYHRQIQELLLDSDRFRRQFRMSPAILMNCCLLSDFIWHV